MFERNIGENQKRYNEIYAIQGKMKNSCLVGKMEYSKPCGKGKYRGVDNTKIGIKRGNSY